jgi:hypothetical protein
MRMNIDYPRPAMRGPSLMLECTCRRRIDQRTGEAKLQENRSKTGMSHITHARHGLIAIGSALTLAAGLTFAAERNEVRDGIQSTIDKTNALQKRSAPGREIAAALFEDDLMITGEGEDKGYKGLSSFIDTFVGLSAGASNCDLKLIDPIRSSGNLAAAFLSQHCTASKAGEKDEDSRVLFVFRKGAEAGASPWDTGAAARSSASRGALPRQCPPAATGPRAETRTPIQP